MHRSFVLVPIALTLVMAGCGKAPERSKDVQTLDVREEAAIDEALAGAERQLVDGGQIHLVRRGGRVPPAAALYRLVQVLILGNRNAAGLPVE